jgi:ABC-type lipoprotein release transport system permease subunit
MNSAGFIKIFVGSFINTGRENLDKSFPIISLNNFKNIVNFTSTALGIEILILSQS